MPPLYTDEDLLAIAPAGDAPKPKKPRAPGLDLSKAGPVSIPANIPSLPPVTPVRTMPRPGQNPATVAEIDGLLNEQARPVAPLYSDDDLLAIKPAGASPKPPAPGKLPFRNPDTHAAFSGLQADARAKGLEVRIVSGDRSPEEQARIWNKPDNVPGRSPDVRIQKGGKGLPVARPGTSKHEQGDAGDIVVYRNGKRVPYSEIIPLAQARGLHQLPGDPPHFTFRPGPGARIRTAEELTRTARTPAPARQGPLYTDADLLAIRPSAPAARQAQAYPATPPKEQMGPPVPGSTPIPQQRVWGSKDLPVYDPFLNREIRPRNFIEGFGKQVLQGFTVGTPGDQTVAQRRADQMAGREPLDPVMSRDPKVRQRQQQEANQVNDYLRGYLARRQQQAYKLGQDAPAFYAQTLRPETLAADMRARGFRPNPFQQAVANSLLSAQRYRQGNSGREIGQAAAVGAISAASGMVGGVAGKAAAPLVGRIASPILRGAAGAAVEGAVAGGIQQPATRKVLDPKATWEQLGQEAILGAGAGALLGGALGGAGSAVRSGLAARAARQEAQQQAERAAVRQFVDQRRATAPAHPRAPSTRLPVDRGEGGRFTKAGEGMPAHRTPTLETAAGPVPIRKGLPVEVEGPLSPGTRFVVDRVEGDTVHLSAPNGLKAKVLARSLKEAAPVAPEEALATIRPTPRPATPTASPSLSGPKLPVVTNGETAAIRPPRDPYRVTLNVEGTPREATLTPEQLPRWEAMTAEEKGAARRVAQARAKMLAAPPDSPERIALRADLEQANKDARALAMKNAAERRQMTGLLTGKERAAAEREAGLLREGRPVQSPAGKGTVVAPPSFGKVKVRLQDGREVSVPAGETTVIREGAPSTRERMQQLRDQAVATGKAAPVAGQKPEVVTAQPTPAPLQPIPEPAPVIREKVQAPEPPANPLVTPEGHIRLPGEVKPPIRRVLSERTDDLIQASKLNTNPDDPDLTEWLKNTPESRQNTAFDALEQPGVRDAVGEVLRRREVHLQRGMTEEVRGLERQGLSGRPLVQEAHHYGDPITHTEGGKTYRYRGLQEEYQTPQTLQNLYETVKTQVRGEKLYPTPSGRMSLRDLIFDGKMLPDDVATTGGKLPSPRTQMATAARKAAQDEFNSALEAATAKHSGKLLSGGLLPDPEAVKDFIPVARALVKLGYTSAAELEAVFRDHVQNASAAFAKAVREALEQEDGPLGKQPAPKPTTTSTTPAPRPKYAGSINLERINSSDDVLDNILASARANQSAVDKARRGTITYAETEAAARELGMTVEQIKAIRPGQALNAEEITALRGIHVNAREEALRAARALAENDSTENLLRFEKANRELEVVHLALQGASSEAGRALSAHRIAAKALRPAVTVADVLDPAKAPKDMPLPAPPKRQQVPLRPATEPKAPAGRPAATRTPRPAKPVFGAENRVFTLEKAAAARERILKRITSASSGIPVDVLPDVLELGGFYAEAGLRTFAKWSAQMKADLGNSLTDAQLRGVWDRLKPETTKRVREAAQRDKALEVALNSLGGRDELVEKARALAAVGNDPFAVAKYIQSQHKMTLRQGLTSFWKVNLLSGPLTQARNVADTAMMVSLRTPTNALASLLDIPVAAIEKRGRIGSLRGSGVGLAASIRQGVPTGARNFVEVMKHGFTAEQARRLEIPLREFRGGAKNPYNLIPRLMGASDQFFKEVTRAGEAAELAFNQAQREGKTGDALASRVAQLLESDAIRGKADEAAKYYTYNSDPGEIVQGILRMKQAKYGFLIDFVMPFTSTPANSFLRKLDYSPFGLARLFDAEVRNTPGAVSQVLSKAAIGTVGWTMATMLVKDNEITGAIPEDAGARDAFYRSGRKPYSIKAGPYWISYANTPFVSMLGAVAAAKENHWAKGERTPRKLWMQAAGDFVKAFTDQSFLSGITALSEVLQNPERSVENYAARQVGGVIPLSALLRSVANATDDTMRRPGKTDDALRNVGENLQAQLPGASRSLQPRVDAMGNEVKRRPSGLGAMQPFMGARNSTDPVDRELNRLRIFPTAPGGRVKIDNETKTLTPAQLTALQKAVGRATREAAQDEITAPDYKSLTDEEKIELLKEAIRRARRDAKLDYLEGAGVRR